MTCTVAPSSCPRITGTSFALLFSSTTAMRNPSERNISAETGTMNDGAIKPLLKWTSV